MQDPVYCNNCGKPGHVFHQCKIPITSIGIIAFRKIKNEASMKVETQYLMIRRKDTLGHIDFMRGKYSVNNRHYILNMLKQMTVEEKEILKTGDFDFVWQKLWGGNKISSQYKNEESISREKYNSLFRGILVKDEFYNLTDIIEESNQSAEWTEAEWGFPKGRRNFQEKDFDCALREFSEETGYPIDTVIPIKNVLPFEEIFTGSNYKSYKHKYYLMHMKYEDTLEMDNFERAEVSMMKWMNYNECIESIREYNQEKKNVLTKVDQCLNSGCGFIFAP
jgi:ADP-ribose pyrophosphatase YjhB (NUDIX family)